MPLFHELDKNLYQSVFLEDTDEELPKTLNPNFRYAYFQLLAKGSKCLVQSCQDLHLKRYICYKSLLPAFFNDPIEQKRFIREARVTAMLQHPNTIPAYELGRDARGHYYFTMKLVHGYTLREILAYRERYDLNQLMEVVIQVAYALEYSHRHGVIHRDIKPENILVGPYGEVLLLDWGLAKVWSKDGTSPVDIANEAEAAQQITTFTQNGKLEGTLCYMSPEQIRRDPDIDGRSDIFSLAAVMYELLTGELSSDGETVDQVLKRTCEETPVPPSSISRQAIPALLEDLVMKCLEKDPARRIKQAGEMVRLIQEAMAMKKP